MNNYPTVNLLNYFNIPNNPIFAALIGAIDSDTDCSIQQNNVLDWREVPNNLTNLNAMVELLEPNEVAVGVIIVENNITKQGLFIAGNINTPPNKYFIINVTL